MKLPKQSCGVMRQRDDGRKQHEKAGGIQPAAAWCEAVCRSKRSESEEAFQACLERCRLN
jgi:hypothetical protein